MRLFTPNRKHTNTHRHEAPHTKMRASLSISRSQVRVSSSHAGGPKRSIGTRAYSAEGAARQSGGSEPGFPLASEVRQAPSQRTVGYHRSARRTEVKKQAARD